MKNVFDFFCQLEPTFTPKIIKKRAKSAGEEKEVKPTHRRAFSVCVQNKSLTSNAESFSSHMCEPKQVALERFIHRCQIFSIFASFRSCGKK